MKDHNVSEMGSRWTVIPQLVKYIKKMKQLCVIYGREDLDQ